MRANLTTRDYEMLSAYIDGQLAPGEQRKLEERLTARPELQVALDDMRRTRALLRQAPRRRAPRNFTLTPAMVGEQRRKPAPWAGWFPALSFTSALAALALVVTIVLQFAPPGTTSQTIAMQPSAAEMRGAPEMEQMEQPAAPEAAAAEPEASQAADAAGEPAAGMPESAAGLMAAPTETPGPAILPMYEATAQAFGEVTPPPGQPPAEMPAPNQAAPAPENMTATAPPVIQWDNSSSGIPYADGMGGAGGMGGGSGEGPSLGPLMGPPPAPNGMGGMGGGAPDGSLTLPPDAAEKKLEPTPAPAGETPAEEPAAAAPQATPEARTGAAQVTPDVETQSAGTPVANIASGAVANSSGPILGVPEAGEGGQIVEKRAILGDPNAARNAAPAGERDQRFAEESAGAAEPLVREAPQRGPLGLNPWALTAIQVILGLLAIAAGVAAYLIRLRRSKS